MKNGSNNFTADFIKTYVEVVWQSISMSWAHLKSTHNSEMHQKMEPPQSSLYKWKRWHCPGQPGGCDLALGFDVLR